MYFASPEGGQAALKHKAVFSPMGFTKNIFIAKSPVDEEFGGSRFKGVKIILRQWPTFCMRGIHNGGEGGQRLAIGLEKSIPDQGQATGAGMVGTRCRHR